MNRAAGALLALFAGGACGVAPAADSEAGSPAACRVSADSILAGLSIRNAHFDGVGGAAAVRIGEQLVFSGAFGPADVEHEVPMSASESRFQIASVTKAFTAAVALKLHESGRLDLDAPVTRYLEDFPLSPDGHSPTVRLLAGHLGGIRHYRENERDANFFARHFDSAIQALDVFAEEPYESEPGTEFLYSSYGYDIIAAIVEKVTGRPFTAVVDDEILTPLGLTRTEVDNIRLPLKHRVRGYTYYYPWYSFESSEQLLRAPELDMSYNVGGGNLVSTAEDLTRFGAAFLQPGLLQQPSLELVTTPVRSDSVISTWSFGWQVISLDNREHDILEAEGSVPGFQANVQVDPNADMVAVLLSNSWGRRPAQPPAIADPVRWMAELCSPP